MSAAIQLPSISGDVPPRKRFTRSDVQRMVDSGLFAGERFELIDGDLIDKMGQNPPHAFAVRALCSLLAGIFGLDRLLIQAPIEAADAEQQHSLPEPDLGVLAGTDRVYRTRHPRGDELLLLVEVSDATLRYDLTTKRDLYARASVPEYWVLDISGRRLIVHRDLSDSGYREITAFPETDSVHPASRPEASVSVAAMLA